MACSRRRRRREDGAAEREVATGPRLGRRCFFKIILSNALESGNLGIPKSFLRRCGKDLSNSVLLKVPGGSTWTIEIEKCNNNMALLRKGWREFMEHYSIGHGHLLVFKYRGNSIFRVIIFDKSASEIDYSLSSGKTSYLGSKLPSPETEDVVETEELKHVTPRQRMRSEPHLPYSQPSPSNSPQGSKVQRRNKLSKRRVNHYEPAFHGPTPPKTLNTPKLASEFESEHPFFKVVIQQWHESKVYVPGQFSRQHIQENKAMATLRFSDRSWLVRLLSYSQETRVSFSAGWPAFARGTHLCVGDTCVFELIDRDDVVFQVSVFSSAGAIRKPTCRANCSGLDFHGPTLLKRLKSPDLASNINSEHPFFILVTPQSCFCGLGVPVGFAKQHLQEHKQISTLRHSDRSWPVKIVRSHGQATGTTTLSFRAGWCAFARETHLRPGNVCLFELVDRDDTVFKVSILSGAGNDPVQM